jgi:hypothetical protein
MVPLYKVRTVFPCKKITDNSMLYTLITELAIFFPAAITTFE